MTTCVNCSNLQSIIDRLDAHEDKIGSLEETNKKAEEREAIAENMRTIRAEDIEPKKIVEPKSK